MDDLVATAIARLTVSQPEAQFARQEALVPTISPNAQTKSPLVIGEDVSDKGSDAAWIWGMTNRVFPLKLVTRVCAQLAVRNAPLLEQLHVAASDRAHRVWMSLSTDDDVHRRKRNDARSVGLPSSKNVDKSKVRFAQHFVGRRSARGPFIGGAFECGLIGPVTDGITVAPTLMGWEFSALSNPVLDESPLGMRNLSTAEQTFYLQSVSAAVPAERDAFTAILEPLAKQSLSAPALVRASTPRVSKGASAVVGETARAGAIGRLLDLGAVAREAQGRNAIYTITAAGREALENLQAATPSFRAIHKSRRRKRR
jgi:hypothetical protein